MRSSHSNDTSTAIRPVWRVGAVAGIAASVVAVVFVLAASAIDVPMTVGGEEIPALGFVPLILVATAIGTALAIVLDRRAQRPARTFVVATLALTALSFVPDLTADASTATKVTLALSHVLVASIVIPALATRLAHKH
jgi:hypothetical protein